MKRNVVIIGVGIIIVAGLAIWYFIWYFMRGKESKLPCGPHGYGDVNDDGVVDENDCAEIHAYIHGYRTFTPDQMKRADVNGDGEITLGDLGLVHKYINGEINTFPVCG